MKVHRFYIKIKYLNFIRSGIKKVEGRINDKKCQSINVGDQILFNSSGDNNKSIFTVKRRTEYVSIEDMLITEGITNMLPDVEILAEGIKLYHSLGDYKNKEKIFGMVVFELK